jgi:glutathione peroxidase
VIGEEETVDAVENQPSHPTKGAALLKLLSESSENQRFLVFSAHEASFKGLQALHEKYKAQGLVVVGFPSDDFQQEAKDEAETAEVCFLNYGVTFTMLSPTVVTGRNANPVFAELARQQRQPGWNFNKYLITPQGKVTAYFDSNATPDSPQLNQAIGALLR